jgi:hypothetical protein
MMNVDTKILVMVFMGISQIEKIEKSFIIQKQA